MSYPRDLVLWKLSRVLKQARWDGAVTAAVAGRRVGLTASEVYKIEAGTLLPRLDTAEGLLEVYKGAASLRAAVAGLVAKGGMAPPWWFANRSVLSPGEHLYLSMESEAIRIRYYDPVVLPAVLQTDVYAADLYAWRPGVTVDQVTRLVRLHRDRRTLGRARPARFEVVVDETVLHRLTVPGLAHTQPLDQLLSGLHGTGCSVRTLPTAAGLHPASATGGFTIFDLPDIAPGVPAPTVVYRPDVDKPVLLDTDEAVEPYLNIWSALEATAEDPRRDLGSLHGEHAKEWT
ncbi:helix-turn-helix domain-containing protein [Catenuloplanes sp. NPDC051500]|uniref:helix-turn-helix domain-containing protein n=1 Tax=Catenuloplanes sp. NPDC051500 TaxID=3363959 RepID=UPI00379826C1